MYTRSIILIRKIWRRTNANTFISCRICIIRWILRTYSHTQIRTIVCIFVTSTSWDAYASISISKASIRTYTNTASSCILSKCIFINRTSYYTFESTVISECSWRTKLYTCPIIIICKHQWILRTLLYTSPGWVISISTIRTVTNTYSRILICVSTSRTKRNTSHSL